MHRKHRFGSIPIHPNNDCRRFSLVRGTPSGLIDQLQRVGWQNRDESPSSLWFMNCYSLHAFAWLHGEPHDSYLLRIETTKFNVDRCMLGDQMYQLHLVYSCCFTVHSLTFDARKPCIISDQMCISIGSYWHRCNISWALVNRIIRLILFKKCHFSPLKNQLWLSKRHIKRSLSVISILWQLMNAVYLWILSRISEISLN